MRYLVTGGAGFIGSNIVCALVARGDKVRVIDNLATGFWENLDGIRDQSMVERITGDIRDPAAMTRAAEGVEVIFHQGALGSVPKSVELPVESDSANVNGTVNVLNVARLAKVKRVVFAASSSAYGETEELPKREAMRPMPLSPYAVTKLACEQYLEVFAGIYGLETVNLRYFNVFGPGQTPDGAYAAAIPRFVDRAIQKQPIEIYGDGEQTRDFCFIKNTVAANLLAADSTRKFKGEVMNVAGGRRIALNELCVRIGEVLGEKVDVVHAEPRAGDIRHSLGAIERAAELLGYAPSVKWEEGIAPTIEYLRTLRESGIAAASKITARLWGA